MLIKTAAYTGSFVDIKKYPSGDFWEFAFVGRSNVGKSSLINMLTGFSHLAKTSVTPGKTQTLNFFTINQKWFLVDLPGYGFAKVSKVKKLSWEKMIWNYLTERENLACVFQLLDASIPPQKIDIDFTNALGEKEIPFALVFTKADKRQKSAGDNVEAYKKELLKFWEVLPPIFFTSSKTKTGKEELLEFIAGVLEETRK